MALTEKLAFVVEAKADGAIRSLKAVEKELDLLEKNARASGQEFDRVGARSEKLGGLQKSVSALSEATGLSTEKLTTLGIAAGTAAAGIAVGIGVKSVQAASALNEQMSRASVVFGDATSKVKQFADEGAKIGLSKTAALEAAGGFGTLFTNIGKTQDEAAAMSTRLVSLAADLASFSNTSVADALAAIQSGLNGESEPLRRYAVFLSDATLKQQALADGLTVTGGVLTPTQRALEAYNSILGQTTLQQGDFARTSDGFANSTRTLQANLDNLAASLGEKLIPAVTYLVNKLNEVKAPQSFTQLGSVASAAKGPLEDVSRIVNKINVELPLGFGKLVSLNPFAGLTSTVNQAFSAFGAGKNKVDDLGRATGVLTTKVNLNTKAFADVRAAQQQVIGTATAVAQQATRAASGIDTSRAAAGAARAEYNRLTADAVRMAGGLGVAAAQAHALGVQLNAVSGRADEGIGSAPPPIQVNQLVQSNADAVAAYLKSLSSATSSGISQGMADTHDDAAELADYLQAVLRDRVEKLGNVFSSLTQSLSFDDAKLNLSDATQKVKDLQAELGNLSKGGIQKQQSIVGQLLAQATAITPQEQVAIDQAEKAVEDVKARLQGSISEIAAPGSSFLGPNTVDKLNGPTATIAELQVAEDNLAKARADAVGPTQALQDAQKKLADMLDRQKELPRLIADAQRDQTRAQLALVTAQRARLDAGNELLAQGPEFTDQFRQLALDAGLPIAAIDTLTGRLQGLARLAAAKQGLVDIGFTAANGQRFFTPEDAAAIFKFIGAQAPAFADGGMVGGRVGAPQLAVVQGGEMVLNRAQQQGLGGGSISIVVSGAGDPDMVAERVYQKLRDRAVNNGSLRFN